MEYTIVRGNLDTHSKDVPGVMLPADAFIDGMDDERFPPPVGYEWGEGIVIDGEQFVSLVSIEEIS